MSEDDSDKQYEPTQKKRDDARAKGDIPRSQDLTAAAGYGGILLAAMAFGPASLLGLGETLALLLEDADGFAASLFGGASAPFGGDLIGAVIWWLVPWFGVPALAAILTIIAQRGLVFAPSKLELKLSRISPLAALGNKFGRSGLFEFAKSTTKLTIYSVILGIYLSQQLPRIIGSLQLTPALVTVELLRLTVGLMFIVLVVAASLGVIDTVWQHVEHTRKIRMSRQELMDEMKSSDGDPAMKQQRRQKAVSIAMNRMLADVPQADVVIVNPTHYAVALKWDRSSRGAPVCLAKGVDEVAARIREIAQEHAVPIHSDPPTARALFADTEIGAQIGHDHYRAVAAAIRFAENMRRRARR
jgi:flagellar biosynthetic protein FlhB